MSDGSYTYRYIATIPAGSFKQNIFQLTPPTSAVALTIFHSLNRVGSLTTDEYSLNEISYSADNNLIINGDLEIVDSAGNPMGWRSGKWKNNNAAFSYPVAGVTGGKAAKVVITSYTDGDAKWYFDPVNVTTGVYSFEDYYMSNVPSEVTVQFEHTNGTYSYKWLGNLPASSDFTKFSATIPVPSTAKALTVFHLLGGIGSLTIDKASLTKGQGSIFTTGAVSIVFDDGWASQWDNAVPKLNNAGIKAGFYITSRKMYDYGFSGYMSKAQVKSLYDQGHTIGAHTRTHPHLTTLSTADKTSEISGSRQDLLSMGIVPVTGFVYPFGEYDLSTLQILVDAGFKAARTTMRGHNIESTDPYQLVQQSVQENTTI
jgi:peptidoglycan/xylan/chitin deacetylase (PgdA/CDA1 family)